jgi:GH24 family phage-related lysozyme (muramidase)
MNAVDFALPRLQTEEGFRALPYRDTQGHLTWAYGVNLEVPISKYAAGELLRAQVSERHTRLLTYEWYQRLDPIRQSVCIDIDFNADLMNFPHLVAALSKQDWASAAVECHVKNPELDGRYSKLAQLLLTGNTT